RRPPEETRGTSIHVRRPADDPPSPGLFSARTGIDPTATPPPTSRDRARSARPGRSAAEPTGFAPAPDEIGYSADATYGSYERPGYNGGSPYEQPRYADPGHGTPERNGSISRSESANYDNPGYDDPGYDAPDPTPGPPRRHRYRCAAPAPAHRSPHGAAMNGSREAARVRGRRHAAGGRCPSTGRGPDPRHPARRHLSWPRSPCRPAPRS